MNIYECCRDCEFRHYLCHADCPEKAKADAEMEALKKALNEDKPIKGYAISKKERAIKKRRRYEKK